MKNIEPIVPMEPITHDAIFDSPDYIYQIKWDGVRCLAYSFDERLELFNRKKNRRTEQYPELVEALSFLPHGTVVDGEIIALNEKGLPDFPRVLKRDLLSSKQSIQKAQRMVPIQYIVFDMAFFQGENICDKPLCERLSILKETVHNTPLIVSIDSIEQNGRELFDAVKSLGMEGIVAKQKLSPYTIGKKSSQWLKIKVWRDIEAEIAGYTEEGRSLVLSLNGQYIGNAGSGMTQAYQKKLKSRDKGLLRKGFPSDTCWIAPGLYAKLRYLEWTSDGRLRNPTILTIYEAGELP